MNKLPLPFKQLKFKKIILRFFWSNNPKLYTWHYDERCRFVYPLVLGKFHFQYDNELPFKIKSFRNITIPKKNYHRLIRNWGFLITLILEK